MINNRREVNKSKFFYNFRLTKKFIELKNYKRPKRWRRIYKKTRYYTYRIRQRLILLRYMLASYRLISIRSKKFNKGSNNLGSNSYLHRKVIIENNLVKKFLTKFKIYDVVITSKNYFWINILGNNLLDLWFLETKVKSNYCIYIKKENNILKIWQPLWLNLLKKKKLYRAYLYYKLLTHYLALFNKY